MRRHGLLILALVLSSCAEPTAPNAAPSTPSYSEFAWVWFRCDTDKPGHRYRVRLPLHMLAGALEDGIVQAPTPSPEELAEMDSLDRLVSPILESGARPPASFDSAFFRLYADHGESAP